MSRSRFVHITLGYVIWKESFFMVAKASMISASCMEVNSAVAVGTERMIV